MDKQLSESDILEKVCSLLNEEFEIEQEKLQPEAHLFEDLELDSLDAVDLIVALEKLFGFRAQEEKAKQLRTIQDIVAFIQEHQEMVIKEQEVEQNS